MPDSRIVEKDPSESLEPSGSRPVLPGDYGMPSTNEGLLPWSRVVEQLESEKNYWVCTADKNGKPHAAPVWALWLDGKLYFDGHPKTRWGRNLLANPQIAIHLESGDHVVILEGVVSELPTMDRELAEKVASAYGAKYEVKFPSAEDLVTRGMWLLKPSVALAWDAFPTTLTRWKFD